MAGALKRVDGASVGPRFDRVLATSPAWPSWADDGGALGVHGVGEAAQVADDRVVAAPACGGCTRPPGDTAQ